MSLSDNGKSATHSSNHLLGCMLKSKLAVMADHAVNLTLLCGLLCSNTALVYDRSKDLWQAVGSSTEAPLVVGRPIPLSLPWIESSCIFPWEPWTCA